MDDKKRFLLIEKLIAAVERLLPQFLEDPADRNLANGNVALCVIDDTGRVYGRLFGTDKILSRASFRIAWTKASQVWITGIPTGDFEEMVYSRKIDERKFGLQKPDLIGWFGGQPVALDDKTRISVGFSGMRGEKDVEIVSRAAKEILGE